MGADAACVDDRVVGPLSVHRCKRVCIWLDPGSLVFGEGADVAPEGSARDSRGTRATLEAVVFSFGSPRWWRRWPLLAQIWRQMPQVVLRYPYAGVDFRGDLDMVLPPGEVFDHRGTF
jgi:hypothetical protein